MVTPVLQGVNSDGRLRETDKLTVLEKLRLPSDKLAEWGNAAQLSAGWLTDDPNAHYAAVQLPSGGAVEVPVLMFGIGLDGVDLELFDGITQPTVGVMDADRDSAVALSFSGDDAAQIELFGSAALTLPAFTAGGAVDFGTQAMTNVDINSGAIDGTAIGAASAAAITGTTIDATTDFTIGSTVITDGVVTDATGLQIAAVVDMANNAINNIAAAGNDFGASQLDLAASFTILGANGLDINTTAGNLAFTPAGTIGMFVAAASGAALNVRPTITSNNPTGLDLRFTGVTPGSGAGDFLGLQILTTLTVTSGSTVNSARGLSLNTPSFTNNGTLTDTVTLYIQGASSAGAGENHSFWVDAGSIRLDGSLFVEASPTEGGAGEQLTSGGAGAVMTWAAAGSRREWKNDRGLVSPRDGLDEILGTRAVHRFTYKDGYGTHDYDTEYVGPFADEAVWAMHFGASIVNPVNTLGYMILGFQGVEEELLALRDRVKELEGVA